MPNSINWVNAQDIVSVSVIDKRPWALRVKASLISPIDSPLARKKNVKAERCHDSEIVELIKFQ